MIKVWEPRYIQPIRVELINILQTPKMFCNSDIIFIKVIFSHFSHLAINLKNFNKNYLPLIQLFWLSKCWLQ